MFYQEDLFPPPPTTRGWNPKRGQSVNRAQARVSLASADFLLQFVCLRPRKQLECISTQCICFGRTCRLSTNPEPKLCQQGAENDNRNENPISQQQQPIESPLARISRRLLVAQLVISSLTLATLAQHSGFGQRWLGVTLTSTGWLE